MTAAARTTDQITAELAETREQLAATIDQLAYRVKPKTIATRQLESLKGRFVQSDGSLNTQTIGIVAGGLGGFVVLVWLIRKVVG